MKPENVVIDTNVLVAALRSRNGASFKLLATVDQGVFTPNISVPLFLEYESVLKRQRLLSHLTPKDIDDTLNYFLSQASIREIFFLWRPFLKDPKDDLVLEVAVESQSSYIITFNLRDFKGVNKFGTEAITPQSFLKNRGLI